MNSRSSCLPTLFTAVVFFFSAPSFCQALTSAEARHLLNRTGFGATPGDIEEFIPLTREQAVDRVLNSVVTQPITPPPAWTQDPPFPAQKPKDMSPDDKKAFEDKLKAQREDLKAWWYQEMIQTPSPFTEHMTLFWHNHFTSGLDKVHWPVLMYQQNLLLRKYALGNFRDFLLAISQDPAMVLYLDTQSNHKGHPNENFARELMELFTLGEGHYSEKDVQEAARAFTGWQVDMRTGQFVVRPGQHDDGEKHFLGQTGDFHGDNILLILLQQPRTAEFVVAKLWKEFISGNPDPAEVKRLAEFFRTHDYEIKPLMRELLLSEAFWNPDNRGLLTKSPVDLMVGTVYTFQMPIDDTKPLVGMGRSMGQDLFEPPNVKGWVGGQRWITTFTLMMRRQFLTRLLRGKEMEGRPMNPQKMATMMDNHDTLHGIDLNEWMGKSGFKDAQDSEKVQQVLLPLAPVDSGPVSIDLSREIRQLVLDPVYQLK